MAAVLPNLKPALTALIAALERRGLIEPVARAVVASHARRDADWMIVW
jgi:hypothetical protein